jgi:hypothetical protein
MVVFCSVSLLPQPLSFEPAWVVPADAFDRSRLRRKSFEPVFELMHSPTFFLHTLFELVLYIH